MFTQGLSSKTLLPCCLKYWKGYALYSTSRFMVSPKHLRSHLSVKADIDDKIPQRLQSSLWSWGNSVWRSRTQTWHKLGSSKPSLPLCSDTWSTSQDSNAVSSIFNEKMSKLISVPSPGPVSMLYDPKKVANIIKDLHRTSPSIYFIRYRDQNCTWYLRCGLT